MPSTKSDDRSGSRNGAKQMNSSSTISASSSSNLRRTIRTVILSLLSIVVVFAIGQVKERRAVEHAPDTSWAYENHRICGFAGARAAQSGAYKLNQAFSTYENEAELREDDAAKAHKGGCGFCSNVEDMIVMWKTRNTLTHLATQCGKQFVFGKQAVGDCIDDLVGFTEECRDCWVENIMCTAMNCVFTCAPMKFLPWLFDESHNAKSLGEKQLNACLECDEKMCGHYFISCAGANRRRSGIVSDIARLDSNLYVDFDPEWVEYAFLHCEGPECEDDYEEKKKETV